MLYLTYCVSMHRREYTDHDTMTRLRAYRTLRLNVAHTYSAWHYYFLHLWPCVLLFAFRRPPFSISSSFRYRIKRGKERGRDLFFLLLLTVTPARRSARATMGSIQPRWLSVHYFRGARENTLLDLLLPQPLFSFLGIILRLLELV